MSSVVVIGAQWGDEGKGKIVDYQLLITWHRKRTQLCATAAVPMRDTP